ncbi:hypothetical protein K9M79_03285 [Candidatus Woesearchaeota archaeon]|nr:hypothetical protein [Candidatus Woesearchaeota archaeon]
MNDALKLRTLAINHYKREDIQKAMLETANGREVAVRMSDKGFGKRPDTLTYPRDVLEHAKNGATSFHASEERWASPLQLRPQMSRKDQNELRVGWDFILDIDSPYWEISKLITSLLIKALKDHGIMSVSCKFSGNKGFHIGVPFEAFPNKVGETQTQLWFPEGIRKIAQYLIDYIDGKKTGYEFSKRLRSIYTIEDLLSMTGKVYQDLVVEVCTDCEAIIRRTEPPKQLKQITCPYCQKENPMNGAQVICKACNKIFDTGIRKEQVSTKCPKCGKNNLTLKINPTALIDVDTVLISSRHLYRMVYSLHEKSMLVSLPINPDAVEKFTKEMAEPGRRMSRFKFLDSSQARPNEAQRLFDNANEANIRKALDEEWQHKFHSHMKESNPRDFEEIQEALPEECFPPCIIKAGEGMKDGRKRYVFALINFLTSVGWNYDQIDEYLVKWNEKNDEPLREVAIKGQLRYAKGRKENILPPNCDNQGYYKDMQICLPDGLCQKIKNPVNYSKIKAKSLPKKKAMKEKTEAPEENNEVKSDD